jgi:uncharacterized coiled-coil protein SlyX
MNRDNPSTPSDVPGRVTELETLFTHLQRTLHELNAVVIEQDKRLAAMERRVKQLTEQLGTLEQRVVEPRELSEEKPPHY